MSEGAEPASTQDPIARGRLAGRTAVVTGGGRGLGYAMARGLAGEGADLVLLDLLDDLDDQAERLAGETGRAVIGLRADVTDDRALAAAFAEATDRLALPTALVNAAGVALTVSALETTAEQWRRLVDINLTGTFLSAQAFARPLVEAGESGVIVNIASMSGLVVNVPQQQAAYNASKAGVAMLTASLAVEWLPLGIRVNAIAPGYFASEMTKGVSSTDPDMVAEWLRRTPAGRMGEPDELGPLAAYLCSDESRFVVGQTMIIDGGYTLV